MASSASRGPSDTAAGPAGAAKRRHKHLDAKKGKKVPAAAAAAARTAQFAVLNKSRSGHAKRLYLSKFELNLPCWSQVLALLASDMDAGGVRDASVVARDILNLSEVFPEVAEVANDGWKWLADMCQR